MFRRAGFRDLRASSLSFHAAFLFLMAVIGTTAPAKAQSAPTNSSQSPTPTVPAQSKLAQGAQRAVPTIQAKAQLVVVDVVVTDGKQRPVPGLSAADFSVSEGGVPQTILHFEEHAAATAEEATKFAAIPKLPPGVFTNYTPAPVNGAVNVLLLDTLNTPMEDQAYVRQQLLVYLKSAPPGARIAIFGLTTHLILLQGFTSDPDALKNVLIKRNAVGSPLLDDAVGGSGTRNSQADDLEDKSSPQDTTIAGIVANLRQFEAQQQSFQLQLRAKYTLDAMNSLAHYLATIPGRKNLIWFSGSFPINILPDMAGKLPDPFAVIASEEDEFRETTALLARSQVAVYPIDARGLTSSPVFEASSSRNYTGLTGIGRLQQDQSKYSNDTEEEQGTMRAMAAATGGRAFVNTNGLTKAVAAAIDEGSNFYTITYTPTNSERDGKLRKIKVQLARSGVTLAYRQGYYADGAEKVKGASTLAAGTAMPSASSTTRQTREQQAMMRGAPTPAEIILQVAVVSQGPRSQTEDEPAPGNTPAAKTHGPYRRYSVNYAIDPGGLTLRRTADGLLHADFDLIVFVFDGDGALVNSLASKVQMAATLEQLRQAFAKGLRYHQEISAPAKGQYFFRIAVHDTMRDHYGAVEVATSEAANVVATPAVSIPSAPLTK